MITTKWNCEKCGTNGQIKGNHSEDVWTVLRKIKRSHMELAPGCEFENDKVQVTIHG